VPLSIHKILVSQLFGLIIRPNGSEERSTG